MVTYFAAALEVLFPLYLIYSVWTSHFGTQTAWGLNVANGLGLLVVLGIVGRWELAGGSLRYVLYAAYALALLGSWIRVSNRPPVTDTGWEIGWSTMADTVLILGLLGWAVIGHWPYRSPVALDFPLRGPRYHVTHGGSTYPVNYHGMFAASQQYAVDLTQQNEWGFRASGLYPSQLNDYEIYGDTVYSPLDGTVVKAVDRFSDLTPGERQPEHPAGNHVWLRADSLYVVLAHLQKGSVRVQSGDRVETGQPLAAVGNTGNTSEPHLHVHAVTVDRPPPVPDSALHSGTPVPLTFGGRFLTRNDLVTRRQTPQPASEHVALPRGPQHRPRPRPQTNHPRRGSPHFRPPKCRGDSCGAKNWQRRAPDWDDNDSITTAAYP